MGENITSLAEVKNVPHPIYKVRDQAAQMVEGSFKTFLIP